MAVERRRYPRIPVSWPVILETPERYMGGEARNISIGGAFIHCTADPGQAKPFSMAILAPSRKELLRVNAEMVWSNLYENFDDFFSSVVGVQFTKFIGDGHQFLSKMISEHLKSEVKK